MPTRKVFLTKALASLGALALPKLLQAHTTTAPDALSPSTTDYLLDKDLIFLNNATMGPSPKPVVQSLLEGLEDVTVSGLYGRRKAEAIDTLANFVGCTKDEIVLTHNVTEGINMMVWGVALKPGDEVIISDQEHVGNAAAWVHRANLEKIVVKTLKLQPSTAQTIDALKKAITTKTKVIALPHVPCTTGQVLPIKEIAAIAKAKNILTCIDGAHPTGMLPLNLSTLGVDFYASCCHKWLCAAQGTGYLYINKNSLGKLTPIFYGADGTMEFKTLQPIAALKEKTNTANRFAYGTHSGMLCASITAACNYQLGIGKDNIYKTVTGLNNYLFDTLKEMPTKLTLLTPAEQQNRAGILAFKFKKIDNKAFYNALLAKRIIIRYVGENNLDILRVSTHIYNTKEQLDTLIKEIRNA